MIFGMDAIRGDTRLLSQYCIDGMETSSILATSFCISPKSSRFFLK